MSQKPGTTNKKSAQTRDQKRVRTMQIVLAVFSILLILSMVMSMVATNF